MKSPTITGLVLLSSMCLTASASPVDTSSTAVPGTDDQTSAAIATATSSLTAEQSAALPPITTSSTAAPQATNEATAVDTSSTTASVDSTAASPADTSSAASALAAAPPGPDDAEQELWPLFEDAPFIGSVPDASETPESPPAADRARIAKSAGKPATETPYPPTDAPATRPSVRNPAPPPPVRKPVPAPSVRNPIGPLRPRLSSGARGPRLRTVPQTKAPRRTVRPKPTTASLKNDCNGLWALPRTSRPTFKVGEELGYELSVAGAYVGRFETKVGRPRRIDGQRVLPLFGRARTTGFAKSFRPFVGRYMAMAQPGRLSPIGMRVEATYGDDQRWERVRFGTGGREVRADFTLRGRQLRRDYTSNHEMTDLLSMLYLARQVDVQDGLAACQHVFGARRLWQMTARVDGTESMSTPAGRMDAWRVRVSFDRMPTPGLNNSRRPHYDMDVFLAKDKSHTPLAFVVQYGSVTARGDLRRWSLKGRSREDAWAF